MIDEVHFFNLESKDAAASVTSWHVSECGARVKSMALLLTELSAPEKLATEIRQSLNSEAAPLLRVFAKHDQMLKEWQTEHPGVDPWNPPRMVGYPTPEKFFALPMPPFMAHRKILDDALAGIAGERKQCAERLAARQADKAAGLTTRDPDPNEEPDPLLRIWAGRLREAARIHSDGLKTQEMLTEHMANIHIIRNPKKKEGRRLTDRSRPTETPAGVEPA